MNDVGEQAVQTEQLANTMLQQVYALLARHNIIPNAVQEQMLTSHVRAMAHRSVTGEPLPEVEAELFDGHAQINQQVAPKGTKAKVEIVYQPLSGLHEACPHHTGDWYFSGNYPTPGGVKLLNEAFINYIEQVYQF